MFQKYVPQGFQTLEEIRAYFCNLRMRLVNIGDILPSIPYKEFASEKVQSDLILLDHITRMFPNRQDKKHKVVRQQ